MAQLSIGEELAVQEEGRTDAGTERQENNGTLLGDVLSVSDLGKAGRVGVVKHGKVCVEVVGKKL